MNVSAPQRPLVGIAAVVRREGKVLLGLRINAHGEGSWSFPGGHLEFGEDILACAARETFEETSLDVHPIKVATVTNDIFEKEEKHYVTVFVLCDYISGEASTSEPHKCKGWEWFTWEELPSPLFLPIQNLLASTNQQFHP